MNYKAGTKVEIVHLRGPKNYPSDFIGKQGIIIEICDHHGSFPFRIEVQGVLMGDYLKWLHNGVLESVAIGGDTVVSEELQRTIIVNQRFLKEYVATPKFKRGQIDYRIAKVNDDLTYVITSTPQLYSEGKAHIVAKESELSEVTQ